MTRLLPVLILVLCGCSAPAPPPAPTPSTPLATPAPAASEPVVADPVEPMELERFWKLIARAGPRAVDRDVSADKLSAVLSGLPAADIARFAARYDERSHGLYSWTLWGAAYVVGGGCSDDCFDYWRADLVFAGRAIYDAALADPDSLAAVQPGIDEAESLMYVAGNVYMAKTGSKALPRSTSTLPSEMGEPFDFDDQTLMRQRYPKLCARYGF